MNVGDAGQGSADAVFMDGRDKPDHDVLWKKAGRFRLHPCCGLRNAPGLRRGAVTLREIDHPCGQA